jgi:hypothetical protein
MKVKTAEDKDAGFFRTPWYGSLRNSSRNRPQQRGPLLQGAEPIFAAVRRCAFGSGNATHEVRLLSTAKGTECTALWKCGMIPPLHE